MYSDTVRNPTKTTLFHLTQMRKHVSKFLQCSIILFRCHCRIPYRRGIEWHDFKGALSPGFLLFLVQFCQNYCLLPVIVGKNAPTIINKMNSNEILAGRANHNNFVGEFSMDRVKF